MDGRKVSEIGDSMIGTLWKCNNEICILKNTYTTDKGRKYYVFIRQCLTEEVILNQGFVNVHMAKIT